MMALRDIAIERRLLRGIDALASRLGRRAKTPAHLATGLRGEEEAFFYLRKRGYVIVARRWNTPKMPGDIDLIAWDGDTLCFVEVKTRTGRNIVPAEFSVDEHKQKTLQTLAAIYRKRIAKHVKRPIPIRFDVVSVYLPVPASKRSAFEHSVEIEFFPAAFSRQP